MAQMEVKGVGGEARGPRWKGGEGWPRCQCLLHKRAEGREDAGNPEGVDEKVAGQPLDGGGHRSGGSRSGTGGKAKEGKEVRPGDSGDSGGPLSNFGGREAKKRKTQCEGMRIRTGSKRKKNLKCTNMYGNFY